MVVSTRRRTGRSSGSTACSRGRCRGATGCPLRGLDPEASYEVTAWTSFDGPDETLVRGGDELMRLGLRLEPPDPLPALANQARRDVDRPRRLPVPPVRPAARSSATQSLA